MRKTWHSRPWVGVVGSVDDFIAVEVRSWWYVEQAAPWEGSEYGGQAVVGYESWCGVVSRI